MRRACLHPNQEARCHSLATRLVGRVAYNNRDQYEGRNTLYLLRIYHSVAGLVGLRLQYNRLQGVQNSRPAGANVLLMAQWRCRPASGFEVQWSQASPGRFGCQLQTLRRSVRCRLQ